VGKKPFLSMRVAVLTTTLRSYGIVTLLYFFYPPCIPNGMQ